MKCGKRELPSRAVKHQDGLVIDGHGSVCELLTFRPLTGLAFIDPNLSFYRLPLRGYVCKASRPYHRLVSAGRPRVCHLLLSMNVKLPTIKSGGKYEILSSTRQSAQHADNILWISNRCISLMNLASTINQHRA
jgi:hypothetical protein